MSTLFRRQGTAKRPYLRARSASRATVELRPTRTRGGAVGVALLVTTEEMYGTLTHFPGEIVPLGVLLSGMGITLDDCRRALEEGP